MWTTRRSYALRRRGAPAPAGFALPVTMLALVVIGSLVTAGFYAASQEQRISVSTRAGADALYIAEYGLNEVLGSWKSEDYSDIVISASDSTALEPVTDASGSTLGTYRVRVRRLTAQLFFVESTGTVTRGGTLAGASRTVGALARLRNFNIASDRAMQIYGPLNVGGNSKVTGDDYLPWSDTTCTDQGMLTGVVGNDTSAVTTSGSGSIEGSPEKAQDTTLNESSFFTYGDFTFDELAALASKKFTSGDMPITQTLPTLDVNLTDCDTDDRYNWGAPTDPLHACHYYFPIIYAQGGMDIQSNKNGQGIMLVDGDLHISGGYEFYGIIVVRGRFVAGNGDAEIHGTLLVYNDGAEGSEIGSNLTGNPVVGLSTCAIKRAVENNDAFSRAFPIAERSWIDLTAAVGAG